jgi:hypothetical protein
VLETRRNGLYGFQRRGLTCRVSQAFDFEIDFRIRKIGSERSEMFDHSVGMIRSQSRASYFQHGSVS